MPGTVEGSVNDPKVKDLLLYAAKSDENAGNRLNSVDALVDKTDDPRVRETLTYALRYDSNPGVRLHSMEGLAAFVKEDIRVRNAVLESLLNDSNLGVRSGALHALEPVKDRQQRAHGAGTIGERRPERLHSHGIQASADLDADGVLTSSMRMGTKAGTAWVRRWKIAVAAGLVAVTLPALAQTSKVFRDGNAWVEETTGTLPPGREFRALTDLGSVDVQGNASQVTYVVRKRSNESTEALARKQFEQLRITASKVGDAVVLEGRMMGRDVNRMAADFVVQIPRLTQMVKAETHGGALSFDSIQGAVTGVHRGRRREGR